MPIDVAPLPPRPSAVDACAEALRGAILRGELAVGARLPPERTLAEQFQVNRVTVRSALGRLARERLLSAKQGSGHVVLDYRRQAGPDLIASIAGLASARDKAVVYADLLLVRRQLAGAVLERLSSGVTARARTCIAEAVDALEAVVAEHASTSVIADADAEVLARIVEATGSAVLQLCLNPILAVARELPALRDAIYADAVQSVAAYRALLQWLEAPHRGSPDLIERALAARDAVTLERLSTRPRAQRGSR